MRTTIVQLAVITAVLALPAGAGAQHFHMEDTLRDGTSAGNASGGSFGPGGWTVTSFDDAIWWALPRLQSGYVEFTVAGITLANLPLGDHEVFAMYEAGYGISEPINYNPEFRQNHYKVLVRIYGTPEPGRAGSMKLMWGMCPDGAPGWYSAGCLCDEGFFAEPFDDPGPWTGDPVRIRIEWGGGLTRLFRDGVEVVGVDWSGTGLVFGPEELHMMIGSPRNDGGLSAMPIGAVFSDVVVDAEMGPLQTCPGTTTPDAGPPVDGGTCDGASVAVADATAAIWESGVYPDVNDLNVEGDGTGPAGVVYLRFPTVAGPVTSATLRMRVATTTSAGGGSGRPCRVDGTFDEATITWATRPAVSTTCAGAARGVSEGEEITWDVTSLIVPGAEQTIAIVSTDEDGAHYVSREAGGCDLAPRLEVALAPGTDGGVVPGTDGGPGAGMDGAIATDGGRTGDAGRGRGGVTSSCGCRAGARGRGALAAIGLALALAIARRRRH